MTAETPQRIAALPTDPAGRPVPWFVDWADGKPDFRVIAAGKIEEAIAKQKCWTCGTVLGRNISYLIGPMCAVNMTTAEPPSHRSCAVYSAVHCPFLANPRKDRREAGLPEDRVDPPGFMLRRNPGVALVWNTRRPIQLFTDHKGGILFHVGKPVSVQWFAEGREATREEVEASIDSGLPVLAEAAAAEGPEAVAELARLHDSARELYPV